MTQSKVHPASILLPAAFQVNMDEADKRVYHSTPPFTAVLAGAVLPMDTYRAQQTRHQHQPCREGN